jgi:hypothetical protein
MMTIGNGESKQTKAHLTYTLGGLFFIGPNQNQNVFFITKLNPNKKDTKQTFPDILRNDLVVYPNPIKNEITIRMKDSHTFKPEKIEIYDLMGKMAGNYNNWNNSNNQSVVKINVDHLISGQYILQIFFKEMQDRPISYKIIKMQ